MENREQRAAKLAGGTKLFLWATSFWAGAAVMSFELAGARMLMPVFGMGMEVWAAVIGVSLGALAAGYCIGGKIADARPTVSTPVTALVLAAGLLFLVRICGPGAAVLFENMSLVVGAFACAILILGGPLILLGMVQPMLARLLVRSTTRTGRVVGGLMAAGTIGGILGTIITGLFLIPHLGVSGTLLMLVIGTVVCAVLVLGGARLWRSAAVVLVVGAAVAVAASDFEYRRHAPPPMQVLKQVEGRYGYLEVLEHHGTRALLCNGIFQTVLPISGLGITRGTLIRGKDYIELIPYFRPGARTALLIGVGAGLHAQSLALYGIEVAGVEIEPAVIPLAVECFGLAAKVAVADGRAFLARSKRKFDAIILDAFIGGAAAEHLLTKEAFEDIKRHLSTDGVLAIRLIGWPEHGAIRAAARTVEAVFPEVVAIRSGIGNELQHVFVFASKAGLELGSIERLELAGYGFTAEEFCDINTDGAAVLTDDKSALTLLSRDIMAEHRRQSLEIRREPLW